MTHTLRRARARLYTVWGGVWLGTLAIHFTPHTFGYNAHVLAFFALVGLGIWATFRILNTTLPKRLPTVELPRSITAPTAAVHSSPALRSDPSALALGTLVRAMAVRPGGLKICLVHELDQDWRVDHGNGTGDEILFLNGSRPLGAAMFQAAQQTLGGAQSPSVSNGSNGSIKTVI